MNPNYCDTVTIYNRLKSSDSPDKKECWKKAVLKNCSYNSAMIRFCRWIAGRNIQCGFQRTMIIDRITNGNKIKLDLHYQQVILL